MERIMKFIKTILFALLSLLMFGCVYYSALYDITLTEVERPVDAKERYGEQKVIRFEEEGKTKFSFEDEMIKLIWLPTTSQFNFLLMNKTKHSIKIIWDEAAYVDENGSSKRIMHSGVKYSDRNNPQPPTTIVRGTTVSDIILPIDDFYGSLFSPYATRTEKESADKAEQYVGKSVQVLLPLKIKEIVNEYIFSFKVNDFKVEKHTNY